MAKLYHNKAIEKKDIELKKKDVELEKKDAELSRAIAACANAEARASRADNETLSKDLPGLQHQLQTLVEKLAVSVNAQAASLYIPVFTDLALQSNSPRSFAFVAVFNESPRAASAIMNLKIVEIWTVVGECWAKDTAIRNHQLQQDSRHLASYDSQSGFVSLNTIALPVRWQGKQVGVFQAFNKRLAANDGIDLNGFSPQDEKVLTDAIRDQNPSGLASATYRFQASPTVFDFLGLRGESILENTVIMHVDLTCSSSLFSDVALQEAAQMLRVFSEYIHDEMVPYSGVVERFMGDGVLIRFHYIDFDSSDPATNPVVRAVYAAERLLQSFDNFKSSFWRDLTGEASKAIKLRVAIALGPVTSINMGSPQNAAPTVIGPCVNLSAKMVTNAPRNRNVALVDDNAAKALTQQKKQGYSSILKQYQWHDQNAAGSPTSSAGKCFELTFDQCTLPTLEFRPLSKFSSL